VRKLTLISFIVIVLSTLISCEKKNEPPTVTTSDVTNITKTSAFVGGNVMDDGGATVTERGIYYSTSTSPETTGIKLQIGSGTGTYSTSLTGLTAGTTYYIKAFAINSEGKY